MGFKALDVKTGKNYFAPDYKTDSGKLELRTLSQQGRLVCPFPDCGKPMIAKVGYIITPHFAHKAHECTSSYEHNGESYEHRMTKLWVGEWLTKKMTRVTKDFRIDYEVPIESMKRIADVMMWLPDGQVEVHEIQFSPISLESLEARTQDYENEGIYVRWWLGGKADTDSNKSWIKTHFGEVGTISLGKQRSTTVKLASGAI